MDYTVSDSEGNEKSWLEDVADETPDMQSVLEDRELLAALTGKLDELDPEGRRMCELIMQGSSERASAAELGLPRNTYTYDALLPLVYHLCLMQALLISSAI